MVQYVIAMVHKRKTKKVILTVLLVLVVAGLAFGGWYYFIKPTNTSSIEVSEETKKQAEQSDVEQAKSEANKNANQQTGSNNQQQSTTQSGSVGVNISSAGQSGAIVYVNGLVSGTTSGTCKLTMTKNSNKVEKSASIGFQVSYYICQGFNISSSEFTEKGEWEAVIEATGPNGSGKSEPRKVNVQ